MKIESEKFLSEALMFPNTCLRLSASLIMVFLSCLWMAHAYGQGLVGAPVDPRFGQGAEIGNLADPGYIAMKYCVQQSTSGAALIACALAWFRSRKVRGHQLLAEICALTFVPLCVYFGGMYYIDNLCRVGGCVGM